MSANNGTELVVVVAGSKFSFLKEKPLRINEAVAKLNREGKKVINIVEGPVMPVGPLGNVVCEITIIWEKAESSVSRQNGPVSSAPVVNITSENIESVIKRIDLFLEDEEWEKADAYCEQALNYDPTNAVIYIKKLMVELKVKEQKMLMYYPKSFEANGNYQKAIRFGSEELKAELEGYINTINERIRREVEREANRRHQLLYNEAVSLKAKAKTEAEFKNAAEKFREILHFKDAKKQEALCLELAENARKDAIYQAAKQSLSYGINLEKAIELFKSIPGWKDADELIEVCKVKSLEKKAADEEKSKKTKKIIKIVSPIIAAAVAFIIILNTVIIPGSKYKNAVAFMDAGDYDVALFIFTKLGDYKDSEDKVKECKTVIADGEYNDAVALMNEGKYTEAIDVFKKLGDYKDSKEQIVIIEDTIKKEQKYQDAIKDLEENNGGDLSRVREVFLELDGYKDSEKYLKGFVKRLIKKVDKEYPGQSRNYYYDDEGFFSRISNYEVTYSEDRRTMTLISSDGSQIVCEYDKEGKIVSESGTAYSYKHNNDGTVLSQTVRLSNGDRTYYFSYDEEGFVEEKRSDYYSGRVPCYDTVEYYYDEDGDLRRIHIDGNPGSSRYYDYEYGWIYAPNATEVSAVMTKITPTRGWYWERNFTSY